MPALSPAICRSSLDPLVDCIADRAREFPRHAFERAVRRRDDRDLACGIDKPGTPEHAAPILRTGRLRRLRRRGIDDEGAAETETATGSLAGCARDLIAKHRLGSRF